MGASPVLAGVSLSATNANASKTSMEIDFNGPVSINENPDRSMEEGSSTNYANDLRNYSFSVNGSPKVLSRMGGYEMFTNYLSEEDKLRIYNFQKNLDISQGDNFSLSIPENTILSSNSTTTYVETTTISGSATTSTDPIIDSISNNNSESSCNGYPCAAPTDEVIINGSNYTTSTKVYFAGDEVTPTFVSSTQLKATVSSGLESGYNDVWLQNSDNQKLSSRKEILITGSHIAPIIGKLVLSDGSTPIKNAIVKAGMSDYGASYDGSSFANGKDQESKQGNLGSAGSGGKISTSAVLIIRGDTVDLLPVKKSANLEKLIEMIPDTVDKFKKEEDEG